MAVGLVGIVALVGAVAAGAVLAQPERWSPPPIAADVVVARVHAEAITWARVDERLKAARVMGRPPSDDLAAWRTEVRLTIDSIVGDVLTRHTMEDQGFGVTEAMIDAEIARLREQFGGEDGLASAMDQMQVSLVELRETQRRGLYLQALIDSIVPASDEDIDAYLAQDGAAGLSRAEAAARVRAGRASAVIPPYLEQLRAGPGVWVIDVEELE